MRSIFNGEGYVLNDNRASGGKLHEDGILGCGHCQAVIDKSKWREEGAFCHGCDKPICTICDARLPQFGCEVFVRKVDEAIERNYRREQNAKVLGI